MDKIIVRSWISADGYEYKGKSYTLGTKQIEELKEMVAGKEVEFVAGKNTFTGEDVSPEFVDRMKAHLM